MQCLIIWYPALVNPQWHITPEQWQYASQKTSLGEQETARYGTQI